MVAVLYQQSLRCFGYVLPTAIAAPLVLFMFGVRSRIGLSLSVVLCPLVFYLVFFVALGVFPPYGEVFDLMHAIRGQQMEIFPTLLTVVTDPTLLGAILLAAVVGMIVGATPGLTASAAIAMLLPITFYMSPLFALAFLYVIGKSRPLWRTDRGGPVQHAGHCGFRRHPDRRLSTGPRRQGRQGDESGDDLFYRRRPDGRRHAGDRRRLHCRPGSKCLPRKFFNYGNALRALA